MSLAISVAISVLWCGCLTVFLSSNHQRLLAKPFSKSLSIPTFIGSVLISIWLFTLSYNVVASALVVLTFTMLIWLSLVLLLGHTQAKLIPFSGANLIFWLAVVQLGGQHVV